MMWYLMWYFPNNNQPLGQLTIADIIDISCRLGHGQKPAWGTEPRVPKTCLCKHVYGDCKGKHVFDTKHAVALFKCYGYWYYLILTQPDSQFILFDTGTAPQSPKRSCFEYDLKTSTLLKSIASSETQIPKQLESNTCRASRQPSSQSSQKVYLSSPNQQRWVPSWSGTSPSPTKTSHHPRLLSSLRCFKSASVVSRVTVKTSASRPCNSPDSGVWRDLILTLPKWC